MKKKDSQVHPRIENSHSEQKLYRIKTFEDQDDGNKDLEEYFNFEKSAEAPRDSGMSFEDLMPEV